MASSITNVNEALVDQKVVEALKNVLPVLDTFSYRVEKDGALQNDTIYVPIATDPSAASKTAGTMVTTSGGLAGTSVSLSNFYGASWEANEGQLSKELFSVYWADKAAGAVYQLAKRVIDSALALVTSTNYGNVEGTDKLTVAAADFGQDDLATLWMLAENKIKQRQRSLGLSPEYAASLMGTSNLALVFSNSGVNFLETGKLPQLLGMNTWVYAGFPANSENLKGAVFGKAAICVAIAPPDALIQAGEGNVVERRIITDPDSGISALYTMVADGGGSVKGEVSILYGVAVGQNAIVRIVKPSS